ncbi:uncharacterized protein LOC111705871 [Eurytemora carolleeae]|uniref:uncharacterized protein LOC111705871 n=1 Tax=Eurytemora carolleeae TaxID=1294199 RepID=UPI000C78CCED|nr:uncharacterized protein LOC111705871 [Eurytemora carolleeae]|eukprot:XP_023334336.1 uncharacterized protein LOC111705871 [Eurytemora affinis]
MGWQRRFTNCNRIQPQDKGADDGCPTIEERIQVVTGKVSQDRLDRRRKRSQDISDWLEDSENLKIQTSSSPEEIDPRVSNEQKLQRLVCLFICTVLPLMVLTSTLLRLWYTGAFQTTAVGSEQAGNFNAT